MEECVQAAWTDVQVALAPKRVRSTPGPHGSRPVQNWGNEHVATINAHGVLMAQPLGRGSSSDRTISTLWRHRWHRRRVGTGERDDLVGDVFGVVFDPAQQRRAARVLPGQPEEVQARR